MKIKIVSDGTDLGTKVLDEDGNCLDLENMTKIEWSIDNESMVAKVKIEFVLVPVELVGETEGKGFREEEKNK